MTYEPDRYKETRLGNALGAAQLAGSVPAGGQRSRDSISSMYQKQVEPTGVAAFPRMAWRLYP